MLPFGVQAKVGFAPNTADGDNNSYKSTGGINPDSLSGAQLTHYQVTAAPIDGLSIGIDYAEGSDTTASIAQDPTSGNYYAQYAFGNFKIGYNKGKLETAKTTDKYDTASADTATALNGDAYESDGIGIEFAVNDQLSISFTSEDFSRSDKTMAATASTNSVSTVTSEQRTIMAAYNIGGATLGLAMVDTDNSDYTDNREERKSVISLGMEF